MKIEDGKLIIHPQDIAEALPKEDKLEFIKHHVLSADVIQMVLDYICDGDESGWWAGDSDETRAAFLKRVEDTHLAEFSRYNWESLGTACDKIKKIRSEQHLYWLLYHHPEAHDLSISDWLRKNDIDAKLSQHCTKIADKEIEQIVSALKEEISDLKK